MMLSSLTVESVVQKSANRVATNQTMIHFRLGSNPSCGAASSSQILFCEMFLIFRGSTASTTVRELVAFVRHQWRVLATSIVVQIDLGPYCSWSLPVGMMG